MIQMKHQKLQAEWISPSNIALIKYWGKFPGQLPANPSLSMTLSESYTQTRVSCEGRKNDMGFTLFFEGREKPDFNEKVGTFLSELTNQFSFLNQYHLIIESTNTFPHSSGIASSASSMSALALCIGEISRKLTGIETLDEDFFRSASENARKGSGSACRSVFGGYSLWGEIKMVDNSSDLRAVPFNSGIHDIFKDLQDTILVVNAGRKNTSSSSGHRLMETHPYASRRYELAQRNIELMLNALKTGNTSEFVRITENEALGLHGLMMTSDPGFILLEAGTIEIIKKIRSYREINGEFICFTLDAGPNVHILYPAENAGKIRVFIESELKSFCQNGSIIWDHCGEGPVRVNN